MGRRRDHGHSRRRRGIAAGGSARRLLGAKARAATGQARPGWFRARWPILRFVILMAVLMALFYAFTMTAFFQKSVYPRQVRYNARASAAILRLCGVDAIARGTAVSSPAYSVQIRRGCEAIEPSALFAAAILAFPSRWRARLLGVLIGVPLLAILNLVRIVTLYFTGAHFPNFFETMHVEVWQPAFIVLALFMWVLWALWATRSRPSRRHAAD